MTERETEMVVKGPFKPVLNNTRINMAIILTDIIPIPLFIDLSHDGVAKLKCCGGG